MRLALNAVTFRQPPDFTLGPISLELDGGQWLGLVGPNGAGKTTLLRIMAGTVRPDRGTLTYDGTPVRTLSPTQRSRIRAVVPQRLVLPFDLSVSSVVELGRLAHLAPGERLLPLTGKDRSRVAESLYLTDTEHLAGRSFRTLSGGEQQRVLLAMALTQEAPLLLLDEPTASLDPGHARQFLELVGQLVGAGKTVVMAHHDLTTVAQSCTTVLLLAEGQAKAYGEVTAVLTPGQLTEVYGTPLGVMPHPVTGRPLVFDRAR